MGEVARTRADSKDTVALLLMLLLLTAHTWNRRCTVPQRMWLLLLQNQHVVIAGEMAGADLPM
jgi:hypothetical protein